jgi:peptidoglycan/LPS O-acetylase OafA/YrhL
VENGVFSVLSIVLYQLEIRASMVPRRPPPPILALGFALMLPRLAAGTHAMGTAWLARMSYSLYLTHYPLFVLAAWAFAIKPMEPGTDSFSHFAGFTCAALILAVAMYYVFERKTAMLHRFLAWLFRPVAPTDSSNRSRQLAG